MRYQRPRGLQDILPEKAGEWQLAEGTFREVCRRYRYAEIRTPIFEDTDLFVRAVGAETDIVSKEMYTFQDRSGNSLTLRAEGTAPAVRAYLENNLRGQDRERLVKLFYIGPIFRYDRPQAGRYRQHHQAGLEAIGSPEPAVDAEIIDLALAFYEALGISQVELRLNSVGCPACRPAIEESLRAYLEPHAPELCALCQHRFETNLLRVLDCKDPACQAIVTDEGVAASTTALLCEECREHFAQVQECLGDLDIAYVLDPRLVRGLDYYTKTAFEFKATGLGAQDSIGGGGRYDGLVEQCGGPPTPGVGIGMGLERILLVREALGLSATPAERHGVLVVPVGEGAWREGVRVAAALRDAGVEADVDYRRRSLKSQLRFADAERFAQAVILGEDELARGVAAVRDLESGEQAQVAREELAAAVGGKTAPPVAPG